LRAQNAVKPQPTSRPIGAVSPLLIVVPMILANTNQNTPPPIIGY